jgi:uncharacterized membrane protein
LFYRYQTQTPNTWRTTGSWTHYLYSTAIRIAACIAVTFLYVALRSLSPTFGDGAIARAGTFGLMLWAVTILPVVLEVALFANWHRGFVLGLLLDWLAVCVLASTAAPIATSIV